MSYYDIVCFAYDIVTYNIVCKTYYIVCHHRHYTISYVQHTILYIGNNPDVRLPFRVRTRKTYDKSAKRILEDTSLTDFSYGSPLYLLFVRKPAA